MSSDPSSRPLAEAIYSLSAAVVRMIPRDLSLTSTSTLSALKRSGPLRITELAALQGVAQPSMTALVKSLETQGLAARSSDPEDQRAVLVSITSLGDEVLARRRSAGAELIRDQLSRLSPDSLVALQVAERAIGELAEFATSPALVGS